MTENDDSPSHGGDPSAKKRSSAALVALQGAGESSEDVAASLAELTRLVETLGYNVAATYIQKRRTPCPRTLVGEGKLATIAAATGGPGVEAINAGRARAHVEKKDQPLDSEDDAGMSEEPADAEITTADEPLGVKIDVVIFDQELSPTQIRNLERATGVPVLDRPFVIVDIFHRHAHSREARLQVEIARLRYLAPRIAMQLMERGPKDRQSGGAGGRGAGETSLELDRRKIRDRIVQLSRDLEGIQKERRERRERRRDCSRVALVGYTNAGKSSLMRALTGTDVYIENKLFATLDTTVRSLVPESTPRILVSDTVGFISKLPHDLVASFRSTLDEAGEASLLLHVVDASDPAFRAQMQVTRDVLAEIDGMAVPTLLVFNKIDRLAKPALAALRAEFPAAVFVSAVASESVRLLRERILAHFEENMTDVELTIPYAKSALLGELRRAVRVLSETHGEEGSSFVVRGFPDAIAKLRRGLVQ